MGNGGDTVICRTYHKVHPTIISVEAANDSIKLHPSVTISVKIMDVTYFMEPSMHKIVTARLVCKVTVPKQ
ncbi:hypothetical protein ACTXT7_005003 [Hymenolepis weldensis]